MRPFGGAIGRNYARRRLREYFRRNKGLFPDRTELLVRMYHAPVDWDSFLDQLERLLAQAGKQRDRMAVKEASPREERRSRVTR